MSVCVPFAEKGEVDGANARPRLPAGITGATAAVRDQKISNQLQHVAMTATRKPLTWSSSFRRWRPRKTDEKERKKGKQVGVVESRKERRKGEEKSEKSLDERRRKEREQEAWNRKRKRKRHKYGAPTGKGQGTEDAGRNALP